MVALLATVAAFLVPVLIGLSRNIALGYDEALYAQATRHWATLGASEVSGWGIHRPPALPIVGIPFYVAGSGEEWAMRLTGVASGLCIIAAAWWGANTLAGGLAGLVAAATVAAASPIQVEAASYLTDLPSTAVLLALAALCLNVLWAPRTRWQDFVLMAALAVLAFYLRYGAALGVIALLVAALATRRECIASRGAAAGAVAGAILLIPHVIGAMSATGSPLGILEAARRAAASGGTLPLADYLGWLPFDLVGPIGAGLVVLAVGMTVWLIARRGDAVEPFRGRGLFVATAAGMSLVLVGVTVHAEPRYVLFPIVLLVMLGAAGVARFATRPVRRRWSVPVVVAALAVAVVVGAVRTTAVVADRSARWDWLRAVGRDIGDDAGGRSCSALTSDVPIIAWYSSCNAVNFLTGGERDRVSLLTGTRRYLVVRSDGRLQLDDAAMRSLTSDEEPWRTYPDGFGNEVAEVFRLAP